jgi:DnaD/phage-associated family protein
MSPFTGFPPGTSFVPVPAPFFGPLLEEIQDLAELQCAMRLIYLLHRQEGSLRFVAASALSADSTLLRALRHVEPAERPRQALQRAMEACIARRLFLRVPVHGEQGTDALLLLNIPANQRAVDRIQTGELLVPDWKPAEPLEETTPRSDVFRLYEENIGIITPLIAEELQDAEQTYPSSWIGDAIQEAVQQNKRSWRYIAAILRRWAQEGRSGGAVRRRSEKVPVTSIFRRS